MGDWLFTCCGGSLHFLYVPLVGYTEYKWVLGGLLLVLLFLFSVRMMVRHRVVLSRVAKYTSLLALLLSLLLGVLQASSLLPPRLLSLSALQSLWSTSKVQGYLGAVSMAVVLDGSPGVASWCRDQRAERLWPSSSSEPFFSPANVPVLSLEESREIAAKVKAKSRHWIHMNERAGPLPTYIYGTYWMYLSFHKGMPVASSMNAAKASYYSRQLSPLPSSSTSTSSSSSSSTSSPSSSPPASSGIESLGDYLATSSVTYEDTVFLYNAELAQEFKGMYDTIGAALERHLGAPVVYAPDLFLSSRSGQSSESSPPPINRQQQQRRQQQASSSSPVHDAEFSFPGFTVFHSHLIFDQSIFQAHVDAWQPAISCPQSKRATFTLAIEVDDSDDREGMGLDYWEPDLELCTEEYMEREIGKDGACEGEARIAKCFRKKRIRYKTGEMAIHRGYLIHAVGRWEMGKKGGGHDNMRITVQGFGCLEEGRWIFFW